MIDALRGSALLGLFLLPAVLRFDFGRGPDGTPDAVTAWDRTVQMQVLALTSGKAYAVFAMMFGLSFFLIIDRAARRGVDFRRRFLWRLGVLATIGYGMGLFY